MPTPLAVRAGAWTELRVGRNPEVAETERALAMIAERALQHGAHAGLEALRREAPRLSGGSPAAQKRLAALRLALVAARTREREAQARQAHLLRRCNQLQRAVSHLEHRQRHAAHDLRTPLLVIQGYVGMMLKGAAGPLTPTMQRYLQQLLKASGDQCALIDRRLSAEGPPEDLRALLCAAFERPARARRVPVRLEFTTPTVPVRGPAPVLDMLARTLARGLSVAGARAAELTVDALEGTGPWRLRLCARTERPLPPRTVALLEQLVTRLGGTLSLQHRPRLALTLHLPSAG